MKTKILSLIALLVLVSGISNNTYAATANSADYIVLNDINNINKIEVHGNVELFISTSAAGQVKVYNKYYSESALVQNSKGVLRISSYTPEKLIVWVSANDLRSVSAYDNADIRSFGDLSNIEFSVDLHDNATAKLNLDVYSADVTLKDNSSIELTGTANEYTLNRSTASKLMSADFTVTHYNDNRINTPVIVKKDELAGLE